ncbi:MAG: GNAT family N-acetyltransferase [Myxococcales bacterium]|jgi:RimJ/RimL family protein N-acetyltransferase
MESHAHLHPAIRAPLPDVTTARLDLRRFTRDDLDGLASVFARVEVWQFPYGRSFSREETAVFIDAQIHEWERSGFGLWVARELKSGKVIGYVGLAVPTFFPEILPAVEVGWRFHPAVWGQGLATEGASAALQAAFDVLGLEEVCSLPQSINPASVAVCERLGMIFVRDVMIPGNDRRGPVEAKLFRTRHGEWSPPRETPR